MDGTLTLQPAMPKPDVVDMCELVLAASRVIAPLVPIASFAARSPWARLEEQSFEETARWLKDIRNVDIYPSISLLQNARIRKEIAPECLEKALQRWIDSQSLNLPRELIEQFCRATLQLDELPAQALAEIASKGLAKNINDLVVPTIKHPPVQTLSFRCEQEHALNRHLIRWCKLFLNESHSTWALPNRQEGFYRSWRRLVQHDPELNRTQRKLLKNIPLEAADALKEVLSALQIPPEQFQGYFEAHLLSLPGWAGMVLWRSQRMLIEYLTVRILMEWTLVLPYLPLPERHSDQQTLLIQLIAAWAHWGDMPLEAWVHLPATEQKARLTLAYRFDDLVRRQLWLEAWEQTYENRLKEKVFSKPSISIRPKTVAQFVFCIDTRSEPFRRALETAGPFETFGVAGFFGLPIETCELGSEHGHASLPVIQEPQHKIRELAAAVDSESYKERRQATQSVKNTFQTMKQNIMTSLLLPEVSGPWLSLQMLAHSFFPRSAGRAFGKLRHEWLRKPFTYLSLDYVHNDVGLPVGFSEEEKVDYVRQTLKMMGLTKDFAPLVVICGHGSHSANNPYAAALDCGACGGTSGGFNARVLAMLCNQAEVRESLENGGIVVPKDTVFAAAEHITTFNELRWLYVPELSQAAQEAFDSIDAVLPMVVETVNVEQLSRLPNLGFQVNDPKKEMERFAEDWSEVRPEWGLARNAAFIIGTRKLTKECNLDGRVFLHTYDWKEDSDGALLSNIIAGPATVAQWINLQYYASTVAPHYYGSGNKATQTVTGGIGVMQGNASDLLTGLPWQSVMKSDEEFYHVPLRLLVIIEAPNEHVERLLNQNPAFRQKVQNGWIRLATVDSTGHWNVIREGIHD